MGRRAWFSVRSSGEEDRLSVRNRFTPQVRLSIPFGFSLYKNSRNDSTFPLRQCPCRMRRERRAGLWSRRRNRCLAESASHRFTAHERQEGRLTHILPYFRRRDG